MRKLNFKRNPRIIRDYENFNLNNRPCSNNPRIIGITSGKGGVGKTSIAVNIAISLSKTGNRVIVFDADLGMANAEILMGVYPPLTLYDCLNGRSKIKDILVPGPEGVKLVSGGSGFVELANLNDRVLQNLIDSLQILDSEADFIIIDTAAGISKNVLAFTAAVEELILVVTPEPTSITDAYSLAKIVSRYNLHSNINLVVNRVSGPGEAAQTFRRFNNVCRQFLSISVNYLGYIREDRSVPASIKAREPLVLYNGSSQAAKCMQRISANLIDYRQQGFRQNSGGIREFANKLVRLFRR